jgi:hypothetical protein
MFLYPQIAKKVNSIFCNYFIFYRNPFNLFFSLQYSAER